MQINKETLNDFRSHMIKAAKEFGVDLDMGRITYGDNHAKFSANIYAEGGKENEFKRGASKFGFNSMWYNRSFMDSEGTAHRIAGVNMRARTKPIITDSSKGEYVWSVRGVQEYLGGNE